MKPIGLDDILDLTAYEKAREEMRRRVILLKQLRRIQAGEKISLVFESRETVLYQIQEMVRAERMVAESAIAHEIETYSALLPGERELSATLFIELVDPARIKAELDQLLGLDQGERVLFLLDEGDRAPGRFEAGHSEEGRIAAVHYVRFPMTERQAGCFRDLSRPLHFAVEHPNYAVRLLVPEPTRRSLMEDLV